MKEAWKGRNWFKGQHRVHYLGRSTVEGSLAIKLEPTATYILGVDIGEQSGGESKISRTS
jgi:hypothetical protein